MDIVPVTEPSGRDANARALTRAGRDRSHHALTMVEHALAAPLPLRERTWRHRLSAATEALARAIEQQIGDDDNEVGLLSEIALRDPSCFEEVVALRNEQQTFRLGLTSLREQLEEHPEFPLDAGEIRERFARIATQYRQHHKRETELIRTALGIDITRPPRTSPELQCLSLAPVDGSDRAPGRMPLRLFGARSGVDRALLRGP